VPAVGLGLSGLAGGGGAVNAIGWFSFAFPVASLIALRARHGETVRTVTVPA